MRIPEYKQDVIVARPTANTVDLGQIQSAATQYEGISKGIGLGLEIADKFKQAEDTAKLNDMIITAKKQKIALLDQTRANPNLEYSSFADSFDKELNKVDDEVTKTAGVSETVKRLYREASKKDNLSIYDENVTWGRKQTVNKLDLGIKRKQADLADIAARNTAAGKSNADLYNDVDALMVEGAQIYSAEDLAFLDKQTRQLIQEAELKTKVETNPEEALRETTVGKYAVGDIDFNTAVSKVFEFEGGFVADDGGKGATIMGINSAANPEDFKKIQELYQSGKKSEAKKIAEQVYKKKYWDPINADNLDPKLAMVAFDAAVNQGVGAAKEMLAQSGGDVGKMLELRQQRYDAIIQRDPSKAQYAEGWKRRLDDLRGLAETSDLPVDTIISARNAAQRVKERNDRVKKASLIDDVSNVVTAFKSGLDVSDDALAVLRQRAIDIGAEDMVARLDDAASVNDFRKEVKLLPSRDRLELYKSRIANTSDYSEKRIKEVDLLSDMAEKEVDAYKKGALLDLYVARHNMPALPELDLETVTPDQIKEARANAEMASNYFGVKVAPFTEKQLKDIATQYKEAKPEQAVAMAARISGLLTSDELGAVGRYMQKNGMPLGVVALKVKDDPELARWIVDGDKRPDVIPAKDLKDKIFPELSPLISDASTYADIEKTIISAYKGMAAEKAGRDGDISNKIDDDVLKNAISRTLGGEVIEFGNSRLLPFDKSDNKPATQDDVEMSLRLASNELLASLGMEPPLDGAGNPVDISERFNGLRFMTAGDGMAYVLSADGGEYYADKNHQLYRIDLKKLIDQAAEVRLRSKIEARQNRANVRGELWGVK